MSDFQEGVYLESKLSEVGVGDTASTMVFENFYAARLAGDDIEVFLLDDDLNLTGLREWVPPIDFAQRFAYQQEHQGRFDQLMEYVGGPAPQAREEAPPPAPRPQAAAPALKPKAQPPQVRPQAQPPAAADQGWWDSASLAARSLVATKGKK